MNKYFKIFNKDKNLFIYQFKITNPSIYEVINIKTKIRAIYY